MWRFFPALIALFACVAASPAAATGEVLTLEEALSRALAKNPQVENANLDVEKVGDQISATRTQQYPSFNTSVRGSRNFKDESFTVEQGAFGDVGGTPIPEQTTRLESKEDYSGQLELEVRQRLTQLYSIGLNVDKLEVEQEIQDERLRSKQQNVALKVKQEYYAILKTQSALEATEESCPDVLMQTHLAESPGELEMVGRLFPWAGDYTEVYDRFGLLGPRSLFAHGIHLSERECARLHETGSVVVHCPTSNTFLGSGLFDIEHVGHPERPVRLSVATDIGGGTSYSLLATLGEAYKVAQLAGRRLDSLRAFYLATLGNARALGLEGEIGSLEPGRFADLVVLDPHATPVMARRQALSESLADVLFSLMLLGDDRAVRATYVAGERLKGAAP